MEPLNLNTPQPRRRFLEWSIVALGGLIGVALGGVGLGYFVAPAFKREAEDWIDLGIATNIPLGVPTKVEFTQRKRDAWIVTEQMSYAWVLTSNHQDFIVYNPHCTHLGCPYRWDQAKKQFLCPCHAAVFGPDGAVVSGPPPRPLDRYGVKVVSGRLLIQPTPRKEAA